MSTLKGVFSSPKPSRRNFVLENVRRLKAAQKLEGKSNTMVAEAQKQPASKLKFPPPQLNVSPRLTRPSDSKTKNSGIKAQITRSAQSERPKETLVKSRPKAKKKERKEIEMTEYVRQQCEVKKNRSLDLLSNGSIDLEFIKPPSNYASPRTHRTTASQTIDSKDMDKLYVDGTIRYATDPNPPTPINKVMPKAKLPGRGTQVQQTLVNQKNLKSKTNKNIYSSQKTLSKPSGDADGFINLSRLDDLSDSGTDTSEEGLHEDSADMLQRNARRTGIPRSPPRSPPMNAARSRLNPPNTYQRGVVPKYLKKREDPKAKEGEPISREAKPVDPSCPPNHILLPEKERKETVKMLRKNYAEFVKELNMMPVRTDTLRMQKRKMELEKQLNKLEEGIKLFSRPKVYVKIGT